MRTRQEGFVWCWWRSTTLTWYMLWF